MGMSEKPGVSKRLRLRHWSDYTYDRAYASSPKFHELTKRARRLEQREAATIVATELAPETPRWVEGWVSDCHPLCVNEFNSCWRTCYGPDGEVLKDHRDEMGNPR